MQLMVLSTTNAIQWRAISSLFKTPYDLNFVINIHYNSIWFDYEISCLIHIITQSIL